MKCMYCIETFNEKASRFYILKSHINSKVALRLLALCHMYNFDSLDYEKISDQGFGEFRRQLSYKSVWYGSKLIVANRWFASSKTCSGCGFKLDKLPLSVREWSCPSCGEVHDRDVNAAKNLKSLAYRGVHGVAGVKSEKPVEIQLKTEQIQSVLMNYESLKQEVA